MDPLGNTGDYHYPLHALSRRVHAALALHDRIEGHDWMIGDRTRTATEEDADAMNASRVDLGSFGEALRAATCATCGRELGRYLREVDA